MYIGKDTFFFGYNKMAGFSQDKLYATIFSVVGLVVLFAALPELWTLLDTSLTAISTAGIPLLSSMTGVIGLIFGATALGAGLFYLVKKNR